MGVTPAIKLGIISLVTLAIAIVTRYPLHLAWRKTYVITACAVLYFNIFVFGGSVIREGAAIEGYCTDTKKEPPFAIAQIFVLALFIVLTTLAVKKFRIEGMTMARSSAKAA